MVRNSTSHVNGTTEKSKEEDEHNIEELTPGNESHTLGAVAEDHIGSTSEVVHSVTNPSEPSHEPQTSTEHSFSKKIKFYVKCNEKDGNIECRILLRDGRNVPISAKAFNLMCENTEKDKYTCNGFITFAKPKSSMQWSIAERYGLGSSCQVEREYTRCSGESPYRTLGIDRTANFKATCSKNNFGGVDCNMYNNPLNPSLGMIELIGLSCIDFEDEIHCQGASVVKGIDFGPEWVLPHVPTLAPIKPSHEPVSVNTVFIVGACAFPFLILLVILVFLCIRRQKKKGKGYHLMHDKLVDAKKDEQI